jgi:hypothetical protein
MGPSEFAHVPPAFTPEAGPPDGTGSPEPAEDNILGWEREWIDLGGEG